MLPPLCPPKLLRMIYFAKLSRLLCPMCQVPLSPPFPIPTTLLLVESEADVFSSVGVRSEKIHLMDVEDNVHNWWEGELSVATSTMLFFLNMSWPISMCFELLPLTFYSITWLTDSTFHSSHFISSHIFYKSLLQSFMNLIHILLCLGQVYDVLHLHHYPKWDLICPPKNKLGKLGNVCQL